MGTATIVIIVGILVLSHTAAAWVGDKYGARGKARLKEETTELRTKAETVERELGELRTGLAAAITKGVKDMANTIAGGDHPSDSGQKGA
jgi:hypothetical protein